MYVYSAVCSHVGDMHVYVGSCSVLTCRGHARVCSLMYQLRAFLVFEVGPLSGTGGSPVSAGRLPREPRGLPSPPQG